MTDVKDVNLIIFDTDGTIVPSLEIVYKALQRAFDSLGWKLKQTPEDINYFIGTASGELYKYITPPEHSHRWEELREKSRREFSALFQESGKTFPKVKETLAALRKRGYHLILYSNAHPQYFETVISSLDIRDYFDYAECVHENNTTKPELVLKIKAMFGNCPAAIVGDRDNDIEAARETDSLSIGVLFGYGGSEPEEADITISKFDELLDIFDRRLPIFEEIEEEITLRKKPGEAFVVGITGIDAAGKTRFAMDFEQYLISRGLKTQMVHLDDFHNPKAIRYSGENPADNYYNLSFNLDNLVNHWLIPLLKQGEYSVKLTVLNLETDKYETEKEYSFTPETIVIFEGVFLFRKELTPYIDYTVFLDIPFEESLERGKARGGIAEKYDSKYLPAQRKYLAEYPPQRYADIIVDNSDWEYPSTTNIR